MAKETNYVEIEVETFDTGVPSNGLNGIEVRPALGQFFPQTLLVECSRSVITDYPLGTRFKMLVKLTDKLGQGQFLYSSYKWPIRPAR